MLISVSSLLYYHHKFWVYTKYWRLFVFILVSAIFNFLPIGFRFYSEATKSKISTSFTNIYNCARTYYVEHGVQAPQDLCQQDGLNFDYSAAASFIGDIAGGVLAVVLLLNKDVWNMWKTLIIKRRLLTDIEYNHQSSHITSVTAAIPDLDMPCEESLNLHSISMHDMHHLGDDSSKTETGLG